MLLQELYAIKKKQHLNEITRRGFLKGALGAATGIALAAHVSTAHADIPEWIPIYQTYHGNKEESEDETYYDKNSIQRKGSILKVWTRMKAPGTALLVLYVIDKSNKTAQFYLPGEGGGWSRLEPIQPGSFEQKFLDVLNGETEKKQFDAYMKRYNKKHPPIQSTK